MSENLQLEKPLLKLPRHSFVGPNRNDRFLTDLAEHYLATSQGDIPFLPEKEKTKEELEILMEMNSAISEYAQDFGVDLANRILSPTNVLLYDDDEFKKLKKAAGESPTLMGWWARPFVVTGRPSLDSEWGVTALGHELIHAAGFTGSNIALEGNKATLNQTRRGYAVGKDMAFDMLDEGIVELMSREVAMKYWPKYPTLRKAEYNMNAYPAVVPVVTAIIDEAAQKLSQPREDIWRTLARGELTGDMKALGQFADAFGHEGMREIVNFKEPGARHAGRVALELGLNVKVPFSSKLSKRFSKK